jgi:hypothetical protein
LVDWSEKHKPKQKGDDELKTATLSTEEIPLSTPRQQQRSDPTSTIFDIFEGDYSIKLVTIKLKCPVCGHTWGVKLDDYDQYHQIPDRKFSCQNCSHQR